MNSDNSANSIAAALIAELLKEIVPAVPYNIAEVAITISPMDNAPAGVAIRIRGLRYDQKSAHVKLRPDDIGNPDYAKHLAASIAKSLAAQRHRKFDAVKKVGEFTFDWGRIAWVAYVTRVVPVFQ